MGKVTTEIQVSNWVDEELVNRGFITENQVRSRILNDVLVDTGATRLCLPADVIRDLGLTLVGEMTVKTAIGLAQVRMFRGVKLTVANREGIYECVEVPEGEEPLLGLIPLEDLGIELDLQNQQLVLLPNQGKNTYLTVL